MKDAKNIHCVRWPQRPAKKSCWRKTGLVSINPLQDIGVMCLQLKDKCNMYLIRTCSAENTNNVKRKRKIQQLAEIIGTSTVK